MNRITWLLVVLVLIGWPSDGNARRLLIVSVDGLSYDAFVKYRSSLPTLDRLARAGAHGKATTVFPSVTWPAHTSIVTGKLPRNHRVVGNYFYDRRRRKKVYAWKLPAAALIGAKTIYDLAKAKGMTTAGVLWPGTASAAGLMWNIPEQYLPEEYRRFSTPGLIDELVKAGIPADQFAWHSRKETFLLDALVRDTAVYLIKKRKPELMLVHFVCADTYGHRHGPNSAVMRWGFGAIDRFIEDVLRAYKTAGIRDQTDVIVVSDHGFSPVRWRIDASRALYKAGIIPSMYRLDAAPVRAIPNGYALYLYKLHPKADLTKAVAAIEKLGVVNKVFWPKDYKKLGLPTPRQDSRMGDVVILAKPDSYFRPTTNGQIRQDLVRAGMHGHLPSAKNNQAVFIAAGPHVRRLAKPLSVRLVDVAPTAAALLGHKMPGKLDGKVLKNLLR